MSHNNDTVVNSRSKLLLWCSDSINKMSSGAGGTTSAPSPTSQPLLPLSSSRTDKTMPYLQDGLGIGVTNPVVVTKSSSLDNFDSVYSEWSCPMCGRGENTANDSDTTPEAIRILTCFHQFCGACADKIPLTPLANSTPAVVTGGVPPTACYQLSCPVCHQTTQVTSKGAKGLMTKSMWKSFFNVMGAGGSDDSKKAGTTRFLELGQHFGSTKKVGTSIDDPILDDDDDDESSDHNSSCVVDHHVTPNSALLALPPLFPPSCGKHPSQTCRYMCRDCNVFTCPLCFASDHAPLSHEYHSLDCSGGGPPTPTLNSTKGNYSTMLTQPSSLNANSALDSKDAGTIAPTISLSNNNPFSLLLSTLTENNTGALIPKTTATSNGRDTAPAVELLARTKVFVDSVKIKLHEYDSIVKGTDKVGHKLQTQYLQAKRDVGEATMAFHNAIEARKSETLKELETIFINKEMKISLISQKLKEFTQKSFQVIQAYEKAKVHANNNLDATPSTTKINNPPATAASSSDSSSDSNKDNSQLTIMGDAFSQTLQHFFQPRVTWLLSISPASISHQIQNYELEFITYPPAIPSIVKNSFGQIKENAMESPFLMKMILDFWREENGFVSTDGNNTSATGSTKTGNSSCVDIGKLILPTSDAIVSSSANGSHSSGTNAFDTSAMQQILKSWSNYEKWSTALAQNLVKGAASQGLPSNFMTTPHGLGNVSADIPISLSEDLKAKLEQAKNENLANNLIMQQQQNGASSGTVYGNKMLDILATIENSALPIPSMDNSVDPFFALSNSMANHPLFNPNLAKATNPSSQNQVKRRKMIYHCKFGEFGLLDAQFTEPSGVTVNAEGDIIVADTNNHRIQIFDREGRFKFQFGECGKRDGQLLYPNRVAAVRSSGDIVVTERSPTHQIQIFDRFGRFLRKFGADILQHPRGVSVDPEGRIVIVECKVMRVVIFDHATGEVLHKFGCSKHLEFPNGLAVNDKKEIFISDNRAHSVKVFDYNGNYLRQIGGPGITNYPIGVGIEHTTGRLLVADNHNNFNLTIFDQAGNLLDALESKVKHAQCFDVALLDDDSMVLASKDFRIYVYRYNNIGGLPLGQPTELLGQQLLEVPNATNHHPELNCSTSSGISFSPTDSEVETQQHQPCQQTPLCTTSCTSFTGSSSYSHLLPHPASNCATKGVSHQFSLLNNNNNALHLINSQSSHNFHSPLHTTTASSVYGDTNNMAKRNPQYESNCNTIQAYNTYFSKMFEHPSLSTLSQQWHQNWLLMAQQQYHSLTPDQQALFHQYQQQQQQQQNHQLGAKVGSHYAFHHGNGNLNGNGTSNLNTALFGGSNAKSLNTNPSAGFNGSNNSNMEFQQSGAMASQQLLLEKSCYDRAAKTASSVLSASSGSAPQAFHPKQEDFLSTSGVSGNHHTHFKPKTVSGLVPELAKAIEGPLNTLGMYQPQYWSPYDSVLAIVNDSLVPDPRYMPSSK